MLTSTVRAAALRANVPLWNYFKAAGIYESKAKDRNGINPAPTEAEIRCDHVYSLPLLRRLLGQLSDHDFRV